MKTMAKYDNLNRSALRRLIDGGTNLMSYNKVILQVSRQQAIDLYEEIASEDTTFKKVYEQWKTFREQIYEWHGLNELSFNDFGLDNYE